MELQELIHTLDRKTFNEMREFFRKNALTNEQIKKCVWEMHRMRSAINEFIKEAPEFYAAVEMVRKNAKLTTEEAIQKVIKTKIDFLDMPTLFGGYKYEYIFDTQNNLRVIAWLLDKSQDLCQVSASGEYKPLSSLGEKRDSEQIVEKIQKLIAQVNQLELPTKYKVIESIADELHELKTTSVIVRLGLQNQIREMSLEIVNKVKVPLAPICAAELRKPISEVWEAWEEVKPFLETKLKQVVNSIKNEFAI